MARARRKISKEDDGRGALFDKQAPVNEQPITRTLEENYMPYSMSVIISRAIPEIDGFKPAHRKLLYTMYKMGLLGGALTKSVNVVGQTTKLNPHGDGAIYETLVRLTRGNEALLHPFIESKGSFGKQYSKMAYAAPRYTNVKLDTICNELFGGIDKDSVDFRDNYDGTLKEPSLFPTSFPNILVSPNMGIAVGIASNICSFNLAEVCDATVEIIREGIHADIFDILKAPDFSTGGKLIYKREQLEQIYKTGRGSFKVRAKYNFDKQNNIIEITEIPYTTNSEAIIDRLAELIKSGRLKDISDVRDETDLDGLKIAIDLKRGTDAEKLMRRIFKLTTLEDDFPCNFNVLIAGTPHLMGVSEILDEWHAFRSECIKRELFFDLQKKEERLHLLLGLEKILLDIDKAIKIIRETKNDREVIPNLVEGFDIDENQAEFIAEIKLRNLNKDYILRQISEIEKLHNEIAEIEAVLKSKKRLDAMIIKQLMKIKEKYGIPRKTEIISEEITADEEPSTVAEVIEDYPAYGVLTREGYFKKIMPASLRGNDEQKLKDGDEVVFFEELTNTTELLFFSSGCQCYKTRLCEFDAVKSSSLGDYASVKLEFDAGERVVFMAPTRDYSEKLLILFENGKCVVLPLELYRTKNNRKKLTSAFSSASPVCAMLLLEAGKKHDIMIKTRDGRGLIFSSTLIPEKATRSGGGVTAIALKKDDVPLSASFVTKDDSLYSKLKKTKLPSPGAVISK